MSDFIIKQVAVAAGNAVGGTVGAGVATLAYGTAIATTAWANTSNLGDAKARNPLTSALLSSSGSWYVSSPAQAIADFAQKQPALYAQLSALERFNG